MGDAVQIGRFKRGIDDILNPSFDPNCSFLYGHASPFSLGCEINVTTSSFKFKDTSTSSPKSRKLGHYFHDDGLPDNPSIRSGSYLSSSQVPFNQYQTTTVKDFLESQNILNKGSGMSLSMRDQRLTSQSLELLRNEELRNKVTQQQLLEMLEVSRTNIDYLGQQIMQEIQRGLHNNVHIPRRDISSCALIRNERIFAAEANLNGAPQVKHESSIREMDFKNDLTIMPCDFLASYAPDVDSFPLPTENTSPDLKTSHRQERLNLEREEQRSVDVSVLPTHFRGRPFTPLGTAEDEIWLSPFLCFLRSQCIEVFIAKDADVSYRRSAKTKVEINQVGIRCRFCAHKPYQNRGKRSSSFPSSVSRIYQSVTMMIREHFHKCTEFPPEVRKHYLALKGETTKGELESKRYWAQSATKLGMIDTPKGIFTSATHSESTELKDSA